MGSSSAWQLIQYITTAIYFLCTGITCYSETRRSETKVTNRLASLIPTTLWRSKCYQQGDLDGFAHKLNQMWVMTRLRSSPVGSRIITGITHWTWSWFGSLMSKMSQFRTTPQFFGDNEFMKRYIIISLGCSCGSDSRVVVKWSEGSRFDPISYAIRVFIVIALMSRWNPARWRITATSMWMGECKKPIEWNFFEWSTTTRKVLYKHRKFTIYIAWNLLR